MSKHLYTVLMGVIFSTGLYFAVIGSILTPEDAKVIPTETNIQCWSGGREILNETVTTEVHRYSGGRLQYKTNYGSIEILADCVVTKLNEGM